MSALFYLLLLGAVAVMAAGLRTAALLRATAPEGPLRRVAGLLLALVAFFLAGYLVTPLATPREHAGDYVLIGAIYLAGAVFVQLVLRLVGRLSERVRAEIEALRHRLEVESLLQVISESFVAAGPGEIAGAIDSALESIGTYADADRCFLFEFSPDRRRFENPHEWRGPGVDGGGVSPRGFAAGSLPWFLARLERFETVEVPDVDALPETAAAERGTWRRLGIGSLLAVPLVTRRRLAGFLGFVAARRQEPWSEEDVGLYVVAGDLLAGALERTRSEESLRASEAALRRAKEDLELQNEELRKLDRMKDGLIRDVSHELKTPVAKQAMQLEILKGIVGRHALEPALERALGVLEEGVRRQQSMIRNLLDLARLEGGGRSFAREPLRLDELLARVLADYGHALEVCGGAATVAAPPLEIRGDEEMLWHVFSNLLNNAVKFRRPEVPLRVAVTVVPGEREVAVRIEDNGVGLAPGERDQLFRLFYRASAAREGTGLGLAICRRILGELGWRIAVASDGPGRGTVVTVTLPRDGRPAPGRERS